MVTIATVSMLIRKWKEYTSLKEVMGRKTFKLRVHCTDPNPRVSDKEDTSAVMVSIQFFMYLKAEKFHFSFWLNTKDHEVSGNSYAHISVKKIVTLDASVVSE